jgi:hypothetical protein
MSKYDLEGMAQCAIRSDSEIDGMNGGLVVLNEATLLPSVDGRSPRGICVVIFERIVVRRHFTVNKQPL